LALLAPQQIPVTGITPTFAAASGGGDTIAPKDDLVLAVTNGDGSSHTFTLVRPGTEFGQANPDVTVTVAAGDTGYARVPVEFADTDGLVHVTYSAVTDVTVALLHV
jgi:hypothetical protein